MTGTVRFHGGAPFRAAAVHGGPGAPGSAAGLAREMARWCGTLEPLQTENSIGKLIEELAGVLRQDGWPPMVLAGHSWGAWLAALTAERHPELISGLILIGCPPLEERFVPCIASRRRAMLSPEDRREFDRLVFALESGGGAPPDSMLLRKLGILAGKADSCSLLPGDSTSQVNGTQYAAVWKEAAELRRSGDLLRRFRTLRIPVVLIQGEMDPHPAEGVTEPLRGSGVALRSHLLPECGHTPWRERFAAETFRRILAEELSRSTFEQREC